MNLSLRIAVWTLGLAGVLYAVPVFAQQKTNWELQLEHTKPAIFIHEDRSGKARHYWYFTFTLTNTSKEIIRTSFDITFHTSHGKNLQADITKTDPYFPFSGNYYTSVINPEAEFAIIVKDRKLAALNPQMQRESIAALKDVSSDDYSLPGAYNDKTPEGMDRPLVRFVEKNRNPSYLNARELRYYARDRGIQPGQKVGGIAIFSGVDPHTQTIEIQFSGLRNIVIIENVQANQLIASYKNDVYKVFYDFPGDWNDRHRDMVLGPVARRWKTLQVGPVATKETMEMLVHMLVDTLRDFKAGRQPKREIDLLDLDVAYHVFKIAMARDDWGFRELAYEHGMSFEKYFQQNEKAIWRIHEYWVRKKHLLYYDAKLKRYIELKPGEQPPAPEGYKPPERPKGEDQPPPPDQPKPPEGDQPKPPEGEQPKPPEGEQPKPPEGEEQKPPEGEQQQPPEGEQKQPE